MVFDLIYGSFLTLLPLATALLVFSVLRWLIFVLPLSVSGGGCLEQSHVAQIESVCALRRQIPDAFLFDQISRFDAGDTEEMKRWLPTDVAGFLVRRLTSIPRPYTLPHFQRPHRVQEPDHPSPPENLNAANITFAASSRDLELADCHCELIRSSMLVA